MDFYVNEIDIIDIVEELALSGFFLCQSRNSIADDILADKTIEVAETWNETSEVLELTKEKILCAIKQLVFSGFFTLCDGIVDVVLDEGTLIEIWNIIINN